MRVGAILGALVLLLAALGGAAYWGLLAAHPAAMRLIGLTAIAPHLFSDSRVTPETLAHIEALVPQAKARVARHLGPLTANPAIAFCMTSACADNGLISGVRARAFGQSLVVLSPEAHSETFVVHELVHAELFARIGRRILEREVPVWFQEGLAVLVSGDERFGPIDCDETIAMRARKMVDLSTFEATARRSLRESYFASSVATKCFIRAIPGDADFALLIQTLGEGKAPSLFGQIGLSNQVP